MKKNILVACLMMLATNLSFAQDSTALINKNWWLYATDTNLTYRQIVTTCDSQFVAAGYPVFPAPYSGSSAPVVSDDEDGTPFSGYMRWKYFWSGRCNVATGKLHSFAKDAMSMLSGGGPTNCQSWSALQTNTVAIPSTMPGWTWIGPQGMTDQHIGQVDGIIVNTTTPNEIYATDAWGGIWKTSNANLAPNNTWTCLSDHMASMAGIGVTNLCVDFSSVPHHHLFCIAGEPFSWVLPNITNNQPHAVGIFYSLDDGATFAQMDVSAIPNLSSNPILVIQLWPGNATSLTKYLFVATQFQLYRVNITNIAVGLTSANWTVMKDMYTVLPTDGATPPALEHPTDRFRGFRAISFLPGATANYTTMYVTTNSNSGFDYSASAGLYRMPNCTSCTSCTLTGIPIDQTDYLGGWGSFSYPYPGSPSATFPSLPNSSAWYLGRPNTTLTGWHIPVGANNVHCTPLQLTADGGLGVQSIEAPVDGSYLDNITYTISFTLILPPGTEVDVVLKDANANNQYQADWGINALPTPSSVPGYSTYDVGPGSNSGGIVTMGHYQNSSTTTTQTVTVPPTTVSTTHYVNRLEFGAYVMHGYSIPTTDITLDDVIVNEPFEVNVYNLTTSTYSAARDYMYCATGSYPFFLQRIYDNGISQTVVPPYNLPVTSNVNEVQSFQISTYDPNTIYVYGNQTSFDPMLWKCNITTSVTPPSLPSLFHPDARSLFLVPNATNTDDIVVIGEDGGIGKGTFTGAWTSLNGTGMKTSWAYDIGSNTHTGDVGIPAIDNGIMIANQQNFGTWQFNAVGDGGQVKYGKRYPTRNVIFYGSSGGGDAFTYLTCAYTAGTPITTSISTTVDVPALGKLVTTNNGEYFGTGVVDPNTGNCTDCNVHDVTATLSGSSYTLGFQSLTTDPSFIPAFTPFVSVAPVQAVAPDMYDPTYIAAYMRGASWDQGYFAYCTNATSSTPTWITRDNHAAFPNGTDWASLNCLVADPRPHSSGKRLWAGASGYGTAGVDRVFQTVNGGLTSWTDMSFGLPAGPINVLAYDDQSHYLFAGTDQGIYAFNVDNGANSSSNKWQCYSLNFPNSFVTGLDINRCSGKIYASTYGRGAYEADLPPALNSGGTSTTYGSTGATDVSDIEYISTTTLWAKDKDETRSVYIPAGVTLTIQNCTVNMGRDKVIIVAPGGKLIVNGAVITNGCGSMWYGIEALGQASLPQSPTSNQGWVVIEGGSIIENARYAVSNGDTWDPPAYGGGIVQATNSKFMNNQVSANFYTYANGTLPDLSYFRNCTFSIDNNYIGNQFGYPFQHHAYLFQTQGLNFQGCQFFNRNTSSSTRGYGEGITTQNAGFNINSYCSGAVSSAGSCSSGWIPCRFHGFTNGIDVQNTLGSGGDPTVSIDQAEFDTVSVGVYESAYNDVSTTRNKFTIGHGNGVLDARSTDFTGCEQNIGIFVENTQQFQMEGNDFEGTAPVTNWYNFGTVVDNTCLAPGLPSIQNNTVYRNTFNHLTEGVYSIGCNRGSILYTNVGLLILCNNFSNNTNDIYVANDGGLYGLPHPQGIAGIQAGYSGGSSSFSPYTPAGNTFSSSATHNIVNNSGNGIAYYYNNTISGELPTNITPSSSISLVNCVPVTSACLSNFGPSRTYSANAAVLLDPSALQTHKQAFRAAATVFKDSLIVYDSLIVNSTSTPLYPTLLVKSPWMAQTALKNVADMRTLSYSQFINVLKQNASVYRDPDFRSYVKSDYTITTADDDSLMQKSTQNTRRSLLEGTIVCAQMAMSNEANIIMMALKSASDSNVSVADTTGAGICTDSTSVYYTLDSNSRYWGMDSVDTWLQNIGDLWTMYARAEFYNSRHQYGKADSMVHAINHVLPLGALADRMVYNSYVSIWNVIHSAEVAGRNLKQLTHYEITSLDTSSAPVITYNRSAIILQNITVGLNPKGVSLGVPCLPIAVLGFGHRDAQGGDSQNTTLPIIDINNYNPNGNFLVYPNPSSGIVTFEYYVPYPSEDITIIITNILGEKVQEIHTGNSAGKVYWNPNIQRAVGVYLYRASDAHGIISNGKILITQ